MCGLVQACRPDDSTPQTCFTDATTLRQIIEKPAIVKQQAGGGFLLIESNTIDSRLNPCNLDAAFRVDNLEVIVSGDVKATPRNTLEPCCTDNFVISKIRKQ